MSSQLKIIICVKIFFVLFDTIVSEETFHFDEQKTYYTTGNEPDIKFNFSPDFLSNIHKFMTPDEMHHTFGTIDGSDLEYKVFPMNLQPSRRKRQTEDKIKLRVEINNQIIDLNLTATDGHLVTKNIPVWLAHTDPNAFKDIRYDPFPQAMGDIEEFRMYHDLENEAAITLYTDSEQHSTIEGVVTSKYAIKTLPKRFSDQIIQETSIYLVDTPLLRKRSIEPEEREVTGHFVLFKIKRDIEIGPLMNSTFTPRKKRPYPSGQRIKLPETVYPELLLVIEHDIIRYQSITHALQFILAFWNGVDMVYSAIDKPNIRLHIAGIIISADDEATPYIAHDTSLNVIAQASTVAQRMGWYFYDERVRFPLDLYDIVVGMTSMRLCQDEIKPCTEVLGYANLNKACQRQDVIESEESIESVAFMYYNRMYGGVDTAVHECAHLLGVPHDKKINPWSNCEGYVMATSAESSPNSFKWSSCSKESFRRYFSRQISQCMDNKPIVTKTKGEQPGRWLTLDGQCRNYGYREACKVPDIPACIIQGCKSEGSENCVENVLFPLPGSKCGENKHCDEKSSLCVSD